LRIAYRTNSAIEWTWSFAINRARCVSAVFVLMESAVPANLKPLDPGSPENYKMQIPADSEWYAANSATVLNQYLEAIS